MATVASLFLLALMVFAIVDAIICDNWRIRYMPKVAWVLLIVFLPFVGSILWFTLGKERHSSEAQGGVERRPAAIQGAGSATESDLDAVEREIIFHEKQAEIRRLEAKLRARKADPTQ